MTARAVSGVAANALQKRLLHAGLPVRRLWLATHAWMLLPAAALALSQPVPQSPAFWRDAAVAGVLDALGNLAMVAALRSTDLSVFGPLNALRPLLALAFAWVFLGEHPTPIGLAGVGITVIGAAWLLGDKTPNAARPEPRRMVSIVGLRMAGLALSSAGAVFLKRAADSGGVGWTVGLWVATGGVLLAAVGPVGRALSGRTSEGHRRLRESRASPSAPPQPRSPGHAGIAFHAGLFLAMQWATVVVFRGTLLAYSFVFFQLGMVLQVVVGRVVFGEPAFGRRLAAGLVMAAGAGLVLWRG